MAVGADTTAVLRELGPDNRRAVSAYCLIESRRVGRGDPARQLLRVLSVDCAALDPLPRLDVLVHDLAEMQRKLGTLGPSSRTALRSAVDNWLLDQSPMHLLSLATVLHPPAAEPSSAPTAASLAD